jgi:hypothetical protein
MNLSLLACTRIVVNRGRLPNVTAAIVLMLRITLLSCLHDRNVMLPVSSHPVKLPIPIRT